MRTPLKNVLSLLDSHTQEQLAFRFLEINQHRPHTDALLIGLLNNTKEYIECYAVSGKKKDHIERYEVSLTDLNHPLTHVLRKGSTMIWQTLHRGVRIEENRFRRFISTMPNECGLFAKPVFDNYASACGVVAVFGSDLENCNKPNNVFSLSYQVFHYQLKKIIELDQLRRQLHQIQDVFRYQQQKQKQLDDLLSELGSTEKNYLPAIARDYSDISDLCLALENFESEVLTQRLRKFGADKKQVAKSLNLSPRTLAYKLTKYGCEL